MSNPLVQLSFGLRLATVAGDDESDSHEEIAQKRRRVDQKAPGKDAKKMKPGPVNYADVEDMLQQGLAASLKEHDLRM